MESRSNVQADDGSVSPRTSKIEQVSWVECFQGRMILLTGSSRLSGMICSLVDIHTVHRRVSREERRDIGSVPFPLVLWCCLLQLALHPSRRFCQKWTTGAVSQMILTEIPRHTSLVMPIAAAAKKMMADAIESLILNVYMCSF
jgi:hypothetical protein